MDQTDQSKSILKLLSFNDTGETGAHQAGIHVPKDPEILGFFPPLSNETLNPRRNLTFIDEDGENWHFVFIYYNNRFFEGTRNEFRLTRMTPYIKKMGLKAGDEITLRKDQDGKHFIFSRKINNFTTYSILKLGSTWKAIPIKKKN